jgi:hypothetical protein
MSQPVLNRLVFAGEAIIDLLMWVPALPERGGDMLADAAAIEVGGGFNVMAAAARQGLRVVYAGGHGTGPWGDKVRAALAAEGIRLLRTPDPDADTGFDVALVEAGGERTFVTALGAESLTEPGAWDLVRVRAGDAVYVDAHILKWHPWVNLIGLHTLYELDRLAGRYDALSDERGLQRTVFTLGLTKPFDLFDLVRRSGSLSALVDAEYGSATFVSARGFAAYEILVSTSGLLARPLGGSLASPVRPAGARTR